MKKLYLIATLVIIGLQNISAQNISFGITGGLITGTTDISITGLEIEGLTDDLDILDGVGFYLGFLADIKTIEKIHIQPELIYGNVGGESSIFLPIMVKYYITQSFNLQAGPQLDFVLEVPTVVEEFVNTFGFSFGVGAGFDIGEKFAIQGKYSFGINNRVSDEANELLDLNGLINLNPSLKINTLQIGVIYKL